VSACRLCAKDADLKEEARLVGPLTGTLCLVEADWPLIGSAPGVEAPWPKQLAEEAGGSSTSSRSASRSQRSSVPWRCPAQAARAALGPQTNEERRLTLEAVERRFRRSAAVFDDS